MKDKDLIQEIRESLPVPTPEYVASIEWIGRLMQKFEFARIDPTGRYKAEVASVVEYALRPQPDEMEIGKIVREWIVQKNASAIASLSSLCSAMAQRSGPTRQELVLEAFCDLTDKLNGRKPTRVQLRDELIAKYEQRFPESTASKEWRQLWKQCGLTDLEKGCAGRGSAKRTFKESLSLVRPSLANLFSSLKRLPNREEVVDKLHSDWPSYFPNNNARDWKRLFNEIPELKELQSIWARSNTGEN